MNTGAGPGTPGTVGSTTTETTELGTVTTTIDGDKYEMGMLPGTRTWRLYLRVAKMLGPSLGKLVDGLIQGAKGKGGAITGKAILSRLMAMEFSGTIVADMLESLTTRMDEEEISAIMSEFAESCYANGDNMAAPGVFDKHFMGRPLSIAKWLGWALQVQLLGFSNASGNDKTQGDHSVAGPGAKPRV